MNPTGLEWASTEALVEEIKRRLAAVEPFARAPLRCGVCGVCGEEWVEGIHYCTGIRGATTAGV